MDRFGSSGFVAALLAIRDVTVTGLETTSREGGPGAGIVFGSRHGCRDSLETFARSLASAATPSDLSPAVFAQTVHNSVNGEVGIAWAAGGVSETLISGCTGGSDAINRGGELVASGRALRIVAGGAEGRSPERKASSKLKPEALCGDSEREPTGEGPPERKLVEAGAAVVLEPVWPVHSCRPAVELASAASFFEPANDLFLERVWSWLNGLVLAGEPDLVILANRGFEALGCRGETRSLVSEFGELEGTAGAAGAVIAVRELQLRGGGSAVVLSRDPAGPTSLLAFVTPRTG
jgi:hypothetical protein